MPKIYRGQGRISLQWWNIRKVDKVMGYCCFYCVRIIFPNYIFVLMLLSFIMCPRQAAEFIGQTEIIQSGQTSEWSKRRTHYAVDTDD